MERKLLLLGLLNMSDMYGYQINEMIDQHLGSSVQLTKPTAYRFLNQMADEGYISASEEKDGNRPVRNVYSITSKGKEVFKAMLSKSLANYEPTPSHNTIAIAFLDTLSPEETLPLLEERKNKIHKLLEGFSGDMDHSGSFSYMISHQIRHLRTELEWLSEIIEHQNDQIKTNNKSR
jgi:DNA-binding PadR family transcriptional regulator